MRLLIILGLLLLLSCWWLGRTQCQNRIITKQMDTIKYVKKEQNKIIAAPVADKYILLNLMRENKL